MSMRWTPEQNNAIHARNSNLLVSAGAGSGKTAVLVNRILRLILSEGVPVDRLLVVTFTKAAAGEMKERLRRELMSRSAAEPEQASLIQEQLRRLNHAWITTFHGFCRQLLQRHFQEAGLEPRFRVLDTPEAQQLKSLAVAEVLEAAYESDDPAFLNWAECYSGNRTDQRLEAMIMDMHGFIHSQPDPWGWTERILETYRLPLDADNPWHRQERTRRKEMITEALELLDHALEVASDAEGPTEYVTALSDDLEQAARLEDALEQGSRQWELSVEALNRSRLSPVSKARKAELSEHKIVLVKDLRDEAWGLLKAVQEKPWLCPGSRSEYELKDVGANCRVLAELVKEFDQVYGGLKSRAGAVDYGDLEHKTLKLLQSEAMREKYREYFAYLFIDEYQDSNGVQETLLKSLQRENNRFMVGDVKQSIYRFRLAEPQLFVSKLMGSSMEEDAPDRRIDLNRNFRSRKEIIGAINTIFGAVMSTELGDVPYDAGARLIPGADYPPCPASNVRLTVLNQAAAESDEAAEGVEYTTAEREARAMGRHILEVVGSPVWDIRSNRMRPAVWDDMAVLLRAVKPWLNTMSRVFNEMGIPLKTEGAASSEEAWELWVLIHLLRLIGNSRQDLPLMVILRSPFGGFGIEELAEIRGCLPEGAFREAVQAARMGGSAHSERLERFFENLNQWQENCRRGLLGDFLWRLFETQGFMVYCQAMPGGAARRERLLWAIRQADSRASRGGDTPEALADHLETLLVSGELPSVGDSQESGGVRIMSIHKSKGLEFPIAFIGGLGKKFNTADLREEVLRHRELGFGLRFVDPEKRIRRGTLVTELIQDAVKRENLSEEMRILYVAMTRAMDQLYLYGSVQNLEKRYALWQKGSERFFLKNAASYLEWLMPPLVERASASEPWDGLREINTGDTMLQIDFPYAVQALAPDNALKPHGHEDKTGEEAFELDDWPWTYPWEASCRVPSKLSVTEVNRINAPFRETVTEKPAPEAYKGSEAGMSGAELGTLHHVVLQHFDLNQHLDEAGIFEQIQLLIQNEILMREDEPFIRIDWLAGLFGSSLGKRLLSSSQILREVPFVIMRDYTSLGGDAEGDVLVQGVIDCCFREPDGWVLLDYKTDSFSESFRAVEKYGKQIRLYEDALAELTGETVKESWLYLMKSGDSVLVNG